VESYRAVLQIAKLLLAEEDPERTAETLFRRLLEETGAERGFIVVREGNSFEQRFDVRFAREGLTQEEARFSRTLVREAIATQELVHSADLHADARFVGTESAAWIGACSVLVAPLQHAGVVFGVVYLEHRHAAGEADPFDEEARRFLLEISEVAALFLRRAVERAAARHERRVLEDELFAKHDFRGIVTLAPPMIALLKTVAQVADSDATVLVRGETGTGKELVAHALHRNSGRRGKPLVTINCGALPASVLDAELFGHARGAFTGADRERAGRLSSAGGGTVFLDEIAEIPVELQAKLLRFLQFGEIQRVGSDRIDKVDVRIVAATHHDLPRLVEAGKMRKDLYFRLKVIELVVPPLRERRGDIPILLDHFTRRSWRRHGETPRWTARAERVLQEHPFPGNVRELEHVVERACLLATRATLDVDLLPPEWAGAVPGPAKYFQEYTHEELLAAREATGDEVDREFLAGLLRRAGGNISLAARTSGVQRTYLQRLLAKHRREPGGD
jgi:Nif-specific regulatory protein/two-component system response regulator HydG